MSSFSDFLSTVEDSNVSESPILGKANATLDSRDKDKAFENVKIKYFVANLNVPGEREMLEIIMTTALKSAQDLAHAGDIVVFNEQSTFTKEGDALVMIKFAQVEVEV